MLAGPRYLLRRLREIMAEPTGAQERLDKITEQIARAMVAEVCSIYVLRADGALELFASEGLNPAAVHNVSLAVGKGLVGLIAAESEALNLPDAQSHPAFAYLPETGEEIYHSFLGVPVLRGGRTLGVLVVQNRSYRSYDEEEVEALQTVAMVLAEMIAAGGEIEALAKSGQKLDLDKPIRLSGAPLAEGIGIGRVVLHEPRVVVTQLIADNVDHELVRLDAALARLRLSVDDLLKRGADAGTGEHREVLETYRMFSEDRGWLRRLREAVGAGLTAEAAVERVQNDMRAKMMRHADPYLRDRLHDFEDLANRLLRELIGTDRLVAASLPEDAVIVARSMGAAELLDYEPGRLKGLVLEDSGPTSHVAIVARALGIAAVGRADGVVSFSEAGDAIVVDGEAGEVHLRPPSGVRRAYRDRLRLRTRRQQRYRETRDEPTRTPDGVDVELHLNAGLLMDLPHLEEVGAAGIGLFRTELQFMVASTLPRLGAQEAFYARVIAGAGDRVVTFRTLDVGGDKVLPYLRSDAEENPAMGWRAIRLGLDRPALLKTQARALLKAARGRTLRLMFPMITEVEEFVASRRIVEGERAHLRRHGHAAAEAVVYGAMMEVPALFWQLDELLEVVDFVSIGSNDLMQFMMAADRGSARVAKRFDALSPAFLRALRVAVRAADASGRPLTLCGEIAGRPLEALALLGLGFRRLSMVSSAVGPVRAMIRQAHAGEAAALMDGLLSGRHNAAAIREALKAHADRNRIPV